MTENNDTPIAEEDRPLAASDTLLGQLQRGRGAGYLWAIREEPLAVHDLLLNCITHDPCWDSQVEERADYYAQLALYTAMPLAPLEHHLRSTPDDGFSWQTDLTIDTLNSLAARGNHEAATILRDYIAYGSKWESAFQGLANLADPSATEGLGEVICARITAGGPEIGEWTLRRDFHDDAADKIWQQWEEEYPVIAEQVAKAHRELKIERRPQPSDYDHIPVEALLAKVSARNHKDIVQNLRERLQPADAEHYAGAFATRNPFAWYVAFECLRAMDKAAPFYEVLWNLVVPYLEAAQMIMKGSRLHVLGHILSHLPPDMTLTTARRWAISPVWHLQVVSDRVLEEHATPDNIPLCRSILAIALSGNRPYHYFLYRACNALEILARFPDVGLIPEVEAGYIDFEYSFARERAARAMHINKPAWFAETYAYECLWDCEGDTRELGCKSVSLALPGAQERLQALRDSPHEGEGVQQAATVRLAAVGS